MRCLLGSLQRKWQQRGEGGGSGSAPDPSPRVTGTEHAYMLSSDRILGWSWAPLQAVHMQL